MLDSDGELKKLDKKIFEKKDLILFVLQWDLFRGDLESLASAEDVRVLIIPTRWQKIIHESFYSYSVDIIDYYHSSNDSEIHRCQTKLKYFMQPFFHLLKKEFKVKVVIAPNMRYVISLDWGRVAQSIGISSVVLFREGLVNYPRSYDGTLLRQKKFGAFFGDHLIVINNEIKNVFIDSGFASQEQISVVGAPRMDNLVKIASKVRREKQLKTTKDCKYTQVLVLFFSPGKFQKGFVDQDGLWRPPGVPEKLFYEVFEVLFAFAKSHPMNTILIKPKNDALSIKDLYRTFPNLDEILKGHPNIKINANADLHKELERSSVTVGLNSTAVLEAGLFGRRLILPFFNEFRSSEWSARFGFKNNLNAFDIPKDKEDLQKMLKDCLTSSIASPRQIEERLALFDKWVSRCDASATDNCIKVLHRCSELN